MHSQGDSSGLWLFDRITVSHRGKLLMNTWPCMKENTALGWARGYLKVVMLIFVSYGIWYLITLGKKNNTEKFLV